MKWFDWRDHSDMVAGCENDDFARCGDLGGFNDKSACRVCSGSHDSERVGLCGLNSKVGIGILNRLTWFCVLWRSRWLRVS